MEGRISMTKSRIPTYWRYIPVMFIDVACMCADSLNYLAKLATFSTTIISYQSLKLNYW